MKRDLGSTVLVLGAATFLLALGEGLYFRFMPRYLEALGASVLVVGVWGSLTDALEAAWQYPGGALVDRLGSRRGVLLLTSASLGGILLFLVPSWPAVLAGLVLYMASTAFGQPATFALIGEALPKERRALGFVVQSVLKRVPLLIAPPLGGFLISERFGVLSGMRGALGAAFVLTLAAVLAEARYLPAQIAGSAERKPFRLSAIPTPMRWLLASDILVRQGEAMTKVFLVLYVVRVLGYSDFVFGAMLAVLSLVALLSYVPAAMFADRGSRRPWVATTFLCFTLFPLAVLGAHTPALLVVAFAVGGLREIGEPARKATIVDLAPPEFRGAAIGTYYSVRTACIIPVAFLAGLLWTATPSLPFLVGTALSGAGLVVYLLTVRAE